MQQEQIQVPLKFPDFDQYELVYYRPDTTLIIVRAREIAYPNRRVILKSILVHSPEMNANLQYEFDVLCRVRQYHTAGNVLPGRRQSSQLTTIEDESAVRLSAHGSWKGPASIKNASDCLPFPLEIRQLDDCNVLIYLDLGGISIRQLYPIIQGSVPPQREPMPLEQILEAGIQVSQALELVHRAHTIHQDVNPNNILLWRDQQQNVRAQLIDFDMAIKFEEIQVSKTPEMNGTLPYMSPEQTGRVERSVDYRTDFYSLGVTLWELLIGRQPFYDDDATQVIYAHLARHPDSPSEVNPRIPSMISRIVLKLMKKDPADRYQSASAVTFDLTRCLDIVRTYRQSHNLTKKEFENADWSLAFEGKQFEIATEDICNTLKISKKLIGRDAELSILYSLFRETASGKMHGRIVVLNGAAGVGKQSLVNAVAKNALDMGMVTLISDIPPEKNALPFAHVLYVMEQMMRSVLSRQADKIRDWETAISSELGLEGITVLTQILPLTSNLFKQPRTEAVAPEKLNIDEVYRVVEIFLRSFTSKITPIAIYLPKVLYTPEMTGLLKYLVTKEIPYLLLIVHFKRGTVSLDADEKEEGPEVFVRDLGRKCTSLEIMPLQYLDVKQFLEGCMKPSPVDCADLVNVLLKKTKGNPLALLETTKLCETAGYISFDENLSHWTWSVPAIEKSIELSGSIADYLVSKLKTFDGEALYLLRCAACIGIKFHLRLLSMTTGMSYNSIAPIINPLINCGMINCIGSYNIYGKSSSTMNGSDSSLSNWNIGSGQTNSNCIRVPYYKFSHSKIMKHILSKLSPQESATIHLAIARNLRKDALEEVTIDQEVDLLIHYNAAVSLIEDRDEKMYVANLNYQAALQTVIAQNSIESVEHLKTAISLFNTMDDEWLWKNHYNLVFEVYSFLSRVLAVRGMPEEGAAMMQSIRDKVPQERRIDWIMQFMSVSVTHDGIIRAFQLGLTTIGEMGYPMPETDAELVQAATPIMHSVIQTLRERLQNGFIFLPDAEIDQRHKDILAILVDCQGLSRIVPKAERKRFWLTMVGSQIALQGPVSHPSAVIVSALLKYLRGTESDIIDLDLADAAYNYLSTIQINNMDMYGRLLWNLGPEQTLQFSFQECEVFFGKMFAVSQKSRWNDLGSTIVSWQMLHCYIPCGRPLDFVREKLNSLNLLFEDVRVPWAKLYSRLTNEMIANLQTGTLMPSECPLPSIPPNIHHINALIGLVFWLPNRRELATLARESYPRKNFAYLDVLLFSIICDIEEQLRNPTEQIESDIKKNIDILSLYCTHQKSQEHMSKLLLARAEEARLQADPIVVTKLYEEAAENASIHGNVLYHAYILERHALFWRDLGIKQFYQTLMGQSYNLWAVWGSQEKMSQLYSEHKQCADIFRGITYKQTHSPREEAQSPMRIKTRGSLGMESVSPERSTPHSLHSVSRGDSVDMDVNTVLQVAKTIATETDLDKLIATIVDHLLRNTGSTKALFFLTTEDRLVLHSASDGDASPIDKSVPVELQAPWSILNYVKSTQQSQLFSETPSSGFYAVDPYLDKFAPKSILCCPIKYQNQLSGVIYLENEHQTRAFSPSQEELVLSIMASASLSIENARLHKKNVELTEALKAESHSIDGEATAPKYQIEAPIQKAVDSVKSLKERFNQEDPIQKTLDFILHSLASDSLFSANLDDINDQNGRGIDNDTKDWIQTSLLQQSTPSERPKDTAKKAKRTNTVTRKSSQNGHERNNSVTSLGMDSAQFSQIWTSSIVDCLSQAHSQDFDIFALNEITNGRPLYFLTMHLLKRHGLLNAFELREQFLHNYLEKVESSYHKNPYHNSIHAADVLHTVSMLLLEPDISRSFSRLELFSVCIASAVHDLDHPGVGNPFLVAISHPMATIYNDIAVLESHHASRAFEIAKIPEMTIFQGLSTDQYKAAREMIISTVLATDMAQHFSFISKFKGKLSTESLNMQDDGDRQLVLKMAVKCGDLCNPTKKFNAAKRWTSLVMEEFFRQGEKELALGLPVSKFMDRHDTNVPKCQLGFIDVLVKPLFETWAQFQQNEFTGQCLSNMQANREVWAALQDKPFELDPVPDAFSPIQTIGLIESPFANLSFSTAQDRNRTRKEGSLRSYTLAPYPEDTTQLSGSAASVNVDEDNYDSIPVQ